MATEIQAAAAIHPAIARLQAAINSHDLDTMAACFHPELVSEQPAHPARSFVGRGQLRENWGMIFAGVPDVRADVLRATTEGDNVWTEWHFHGTLRDGEAFNLRGVIVQGLRDNLVATVTFYMEPVEDSGQDVAGAVRSHIGADR